MTSKKSTAGIDQAPPAADFSGPIGYSYQTGIFVAINAIGDAYLLVEGPDCVHMKTQYVQGNHDWLSTLTDVSGFHRVANTALHPAHMAGSREDRIRRVLTRIARHEAASLVCVTAMPMAAVTAVDYDRLGAEVSEATDKPILQISGRSLSGDWLDGYAETLKALARRLPLTAAPRDGAVALVGNLFDRHEEDCRGNVRELTRLLRALDLDPVSIWLDGGGVSDLARAGEASVVVSLPYGRRAARILAKRTGAELVETPLPFGVDGTERWLRSVAAATGREQRVDALLDAELGRIAPKLEWAVPFLFANRRLGYVGDPHLLGGLAETAALLGLRIPLAVVSNRAHHAKELRALHPELDILVAPTRQVFADRIGTAVTAAQIDCLIGNGRALDFTDVEVMNFGFPSEFAHALYDRPYLGFQGALAFADTLANHLRRVDRSVWPGLLDLSGVVARSPG